MRPQSSFAGPVYLVPNSIFDVMALSTVSKEEISHFNQLAATWWDENGPMWPLHLLNQIRLPFVLDKCRRRFNSNDFHFWTSAAAAVCYRSPLLEPALMCPVLTSRAKHQHRAEPRFRAKPEVELSACQPRRVAGRSSVRCGSQYGSRRAR